jgi:RimJ/RimL family protein N-acetyltransferase
VIARTLFREYATWLANDPARPFATSDLLSQNFDEELANLPGDYAPPDGRLLLVLGGKETAGSVALRRFNNCACEMKRMWVRPKFSGCGLGCLIAEKLIAEARTIGYSQMVLDSLPSLGSALALYRSLGFREIPSYRYNPDPNAVYATTPRNRVTAKMYLVVFDIDGTLTDTNLKGWIAAALDEQQKGNELPFTIIGLQSGQVVGSTHYFTIAHKDRGLEIGSTWLTPSVWRTPINSEAKYLLLEHAIERLGCIRVQFHLPTAEMSVHDARSKDSEQRLKARCGIT